MNFRIPLWMALGVAMAASAGAHAQKYPTKTVRLGKVIREAGIKAE